MPRPRRALPPRRGEACLALVGPRHPVGARLASPTSAVALVGPRHPVGARLASPTSAVALVGRRVGHSSQERWLRTGIPAGEGERRPARAGAATRTCFL